MKKSEVDLSKAHVDLYKTEDKSYSGQTLAYTKAGWATVTEDGTIIEVISAFSGANLQADFEARDEVPATYQLDETTLENPADIGSDGTANNAEIIDSVANDPLATTATLTGANLVSIVGSGTNTITATADVDAASEDRTAVAVNSTLTAVDGYPPYASYSWTVNVAGSGAVEFSTAASISETLDSLETAGGDVAADTETVVIIGTATDDQGNTASTTITLTVSDAA